jgi:hypothetical protein
VRGEADAGYRRRATTPISTWMGTGLNRASGNWPSRTGASSLQGAKIINPR